MGTNLMGRRRTITRVTRLQPKCGRGCGSRRSRNLIPGPPGANRKPAKMAWKIGPRSVFVPKPSHLSLAEAMAWLGKWMDDKRIEPAALNVSGNGRAGFEIRFWSDLDAIEFAALAAATSIYASRQGLGRSVQAMGT
jgi:hypothetical protein